jgi:membrane-anchored protein YejM (alkaline phosphatase superfamily)
LGGAAFPTGTTTGYGVFGLIYGASALFNEPVEAAGQASPLLRYLHGEGYHSRIYGVTVQTNPPFLRTAFREAHFRKDRWNDAELGGRMYRDRAVTDAIIADIEQLSASAEAKPLFTYAIYDASHYPFLAPDEFALSPGATPLEQVDLLGTVLSQDEAGIRGLAQCYRNSLRYLDHEIARIDAALAAAGLRDDSLLIILGDHGESFADNGFVGGQVLHNGRFEASQLQTLCAGRIPGHASERISHATGHADLPATILSLLHGRDLAYGHGSPLWNGDGPRLVSGSNYDEICLIAGDQWLRLGAISVTRDRLVVTGPDGFPLAERGPWQPDAI